VGGRKPLRQYQAGAAPVLRVDRKQSIETAASSTLGEVEQGKQTPDRKPKKNIMVARAIEQCLDDPEEAGRSLLRKGWEGQVDQSGQGSQGGSKVGLRAP